ncbi:RpnC/YadD family protein [Flavitalea flava]
MLRFLYTDADQVYDMARGIEFLDKELAQIDPVPGEKRNTRFVDKLGKVYNKQGREECILFHCEIQGDTSKPEQFSERMFTYFYRLRDLDKGPVSAIALFTGKNAKKMPDKFEYQYRKTKLSYQYHILSILDYSDEELQESDNPFALIVLAAKTALLEGRIPEVELLKRKLLIASELIKKGFSRRKINAIFRFLDNYVLFEDPQMNRIFKETIQSHDKYKNMGIEEYLNQVSKEEGKAEGLAEGLAEGQAKTRLIIENLLKVSDFSTQKIASIACVTEDFVNKIRQEILVK